MMKRQHGPIKFFSAYIRRLKEKKNTPETWLQGSQHLYDLIMTGATMLSFLQYRFEDEVKKTACVSNAIKTQKLISK